MLRGGMVRLDRVRYCCLVALVGPAGSRVASLLFMAWAMESQVLSAGRYTVPGQGPGVRRNAVPLLHLGGACQTILGSEQLVDCCHGVQRAFGSYGTVRPVDDNLLFPVLSLAVMLRFCPCARTVTGGWRWHRRESAPLDAPSLVCAPISARRLVWVVPGGGMTVNAWIGVAGTLLIMAGGHCSTQCLITPGRAGSGTGGRA